MTTTTTTLNPGTGGDKVLTDSISTENGVSAPVGAVAQMVKVGFGATSDFKTPSDTTPFPTKLAGLLYPASTNNSSVAQLAAGASFTGTIETIQNLQAAQIQVVCDQPYRVVVNQYIDSGGTKLVSSDSFTRAAGVPLNENITLPGNYFNIVLTNIGRATTTALQLDTTFGIMDTVPRKLSEAGGLPISLNDIKGQDLWRTTFAKAIASGADTDFWSGVVTGTGMAVSQSGGNLVITSGTTINSETILRSKRTFNRNLTARIQTVLSQRIANNNFFVELVDLIGDGLTASASSATSLTVTIPNNPFTSANVGQSIYIGVLAGGLVGVPNRYAIASVSGNNVTFTVAGFSVTSGTCSLFGWNYHQLVYNGTTATAVNYDCQRNGWNSGATAATINTTASPGHMAIMGNDDGIAYLADQLIASATTLQTTMRASRVANIADENADLYLQLRVLNGSTAPATTTTWTVGMVAVEDFMPLQAAITSIKPQGWNSSLPVSVLNTPAVTVSSGTVTATVTGGTTLPVTPTQTFTNSAATTNATSTKATAGTVWSVVASNINAAARYLKLYNKASAPTVGTDVPVITIPLPAGSVTTVHGGSNGIRFGTGIAWAVTTGAADSDVAAVAASEIKVAISYT